MDTRKSLTIIENPNSYLAASVESLDQRLKAITLAPGAEDELIEKKAKKVIRDKLLGLFHLGSVISEILNWNDGVDKDIKEAKRNVLLARYFDQSEKNDVAISTLKSMLSSAQGNVLFNKIVQIIDDNPPDQLLIEHLASALKFIVDSDFVKLFEAHRYALAQIEQISPQALAILANEADWPVMTLGSYSANGTQIQSDWLSQFTAAYTTQKGIHDPAIRHRIQYSVSELQTRKTIEAHLTGDGGQATCKVTEIGRLILPYII